MYYINIFFLYSIIGHMIELKIHLINGYKGGILYGFWTPVYGIGSVIVICLYNKFISKLKNHKILKFLTIFLSGMIILSLMEYIGGVLLKLIFNKTLWNYSNYKYNIGKYMSLEMGLILGISSVILIYLLKKPTDKIVKKNTQINYLDINYLIHY